MDDPLHRKQLRSEPLNVRRKHRRILSGRLWVLLVLFACAAVVLALFSSTLVRPPSSTRIENKKGNDRQVNEELISQLVVTMLELARLKLRQGQHGEALVLLESTLRENPDASDVRTLASEILRDVTWHLPLAELSHPYPVDHMVFSAPSTLWVGLSGDYQTVVRWDLESLKTAGVLFPLPQAETRTLLVDPGKQRLVIERAGILLLCDAETLKPVKYLGAMPESFTPAAVVVFSADGLLMAHPAIAEDGSGAREWHLRDLKSGEIIRVHRYDSSDAPPPLAAHLDRHRLQVIHADGALLELPVSPVGPPISIPAKEPLKLLHALYDMEGGELQVLVDEGAHQQPRLASMSGAVLGDFKKNAKLLLESHPWSSRPGVWSGLLRDFSRSRLVVDDSRIVLNDGLHDPIESTSTITAVAGSNDLCFVGCRNGTIRMDRFLPKPVVIKSTDTLSAIVDERTLTVFGDLTRALTGMRKDGDITNRIEAVERLGLLVNLNADALSGLFPELDFRPLMEAARMISIQKVGPDAMRSLEERLVRADPHGLDASSSVASVLQKALESTDAEAIAACLASAHEMPPILRKLADSRMAWLEGRKADALSGWPEKFPELAEVRKREDWDDWEQADFSEAFKLMRQCIEEEVALLKLPDDSTEEQRESIIKRLINADTLRAVGRARLAKAGLEASVKLVSYPEHASSAFKLAELARNLGEQPVPCLRAEAFALGAMGDHEKARERWVELFTDHPVETHQPGDFTQAAYSAMEVGDIQQAMEILNTGLHRFPDDAALALRSGWIALLSGDAQRAYRFLMAGKQIGFAPDVLEYATALLVVAAFQSGSADDAAVFRNDLLRLNPDWGESTTIDALDWPEELKSSLRGADF